MELAIDVGSNITQLLILLAAQIGTTVDKIWPWYIKQIYTEGWIELLTSLIGIILLCYITYKFSKKIDSSEESIFDMLTPVFGVLTLLSIMGTAFTLSETVTKIANPEYAAITRLTTHIAYLRGK